MQKTKIIHHKLLAKHWPSKILNYLPVSLQKKWLQRKLRSAHGTIHHTTETEKSSLRKSIKDFKTGLVFLPLNSDRVQLVSPLLRQLIGRYRLTFFSLKEYESQLNSIQPSEVFSENFPEIESEFISSSDFYLDSKVFLAFTSRLKSEQYDFCLNLEFSPNLLLQSLVRIAHAQFKIGFSAGLLHRSHSLPYNISLRVNDNSGQDHLNMRVLDVLGIGV